MDKMVRTAETVQEYRKLPKGQQDNIKDVADLSEVNFAAV